MFKTRNLLLILLLTYFTSPTAYHAKASKSSLTLVEVEKAYDFLYDSYSIYDAVEDDLIEKGAIEIDGEQYSTVGIFAKPRSFMGSSIFSSLAFTVNTNQATEDQKLLYLLLLIKEGRKVCSSNIRVAATVGLILNFDALNDDQQLKRSINFSYDELLDNYITQRCAAFSEANSNQTLLHKALLTELRFSSSLNRTNNFFYSPNAIANSKRMLQRWATDADKIIPSAYLLPQFNSIWFNWNDKSPRGKRIRDILRGYIDTINTAKRTDDILKQSYVESEE